MTFIGRARILAASRRFRRRGFEPARDGNRTGVPGNDDDHPREDDRNERLDESPVPDPETKDAPSEDDPGAD
jgi:hypothetical protein